MPLQVVAAEDNLLVREGIRSLLAAAPGIELAAMAQDLPGLLAAVAQHRPQVVLTDIRMPPTGTDEGIRAASALRASAPEVGVIVLSQFADPAHAKVLFAEGSASRGYLLKDRLGEPGVLVRALREVAQGRSCVDPEVVDILLNPSAARPGAALGDLTGREREILGLVAQGMSNAGIAEHLVVTRGAVEKHINAIFSKLGLREDPGSNRRVAAVLMYLHGDVDGGGDSALATGPGHAARP